MPVKVSDLERAAKVLGFIKVRQRGSHARWKHPDGRATTIPVHPSAEIGGFGPVEIQEEIMSPMPFFWNALTSRYADGVRTK